MRRLFSGTSFDEWRENLCSVCGKFDADRDEEHPFVGRVGKKDLDGLEVAYINSNVRRMVHNKRAFDKDAPFCFLVLQRSGSARFSQFGREITLAPGHMVLMDSASSFDISLRGLSEQCSLHLSREAVCKSLPQTMQKFGKLQIGSLSGRLLNTMVEQIIADSERQFHEQQAEGNSLQGSLISLLEPALRGSTEVDLGQRYDSLYHLALKEIDKNLKNARLTAESLAAHLNISTRKLYRAFESQGDSVHDYILKKRLQLAAQDLVAQGPEARSISAIAHDLGFCDSSHLSKAFRKLYQLSPREYREQFRRAG